MSLTKAKGVETKATRRRRVVRYSITITFFVLSFALVGYGIYLLTTPPDSVPDQWLGGHEYFRATDGVKILNVTFDIEVIKWSAAGGCWCATNPLIFHIVLYNGTFTRNINAVLFTNSQTVPSVPTGSEGTTTTGELQAYNSTTNKSCPQNAVCADGTLKWVESGDTWMYLLLANPSVPVSGVPQKAMQSGDPIIHIDSISELVDIQSLRNSEGYNSLLVAVTIFTADTLVLILPKRKGR